MRPMAHRKVTPAEYKALRLSIGRQKEVAHLLGVSLSNLAHRESGHNPLTIEATLAIKYLAATCLPHAEKFPHTPNTIQKFSARD